MIFLDTNVIIAATNKRPKTTADRFDAERAIGSPLAESSIVVFERRYGIANSQRPKANDLVMTQALSAVRIVPFEAEDAAVAGKIRATLEAAGTPSGAYDLRSRRRPSATARRWSRPTCADSSGWRG